MVMVVCEVRCDESGEDDDERRTNSSWTRKMEEKKKQGKMSGCVSDPNRRVVETTLWFLEPGQSQIHYFTSPPLNVLVKTGFGLAPPNADLIRVWSGTEKNLRLLKNGSTGLCDGTLLVGQHAEVIYFRGPLSLVEAETCSGIRTSAFRVPQQAEQPGARLSNWPMTFPPPTLLDKPEGGMIRRQSNEDGPHGQKCRHLHAVLNQG